MRAEVQRWSARVDPPWCSDAWRAQARLALAAAVPPEQIDWQEGGEATLLDAPALSGAEPIADAAALRVPRAFMELVATVACHRDRQRLPLLYRLLWRVTHGERDVLSNPADPDVLRAMALAQAVRRDSHKMKAFVRFREVPGEEDAFIAWFEPDHAIVDRVAPFFVRRFTGMRWAILTPTRSAYWDGTELRMGDGASRSDAPDEDAQESLWRAYYANIFNPARLNQRMMRQEMPVKYWKHLPEVSLLPSLVRDAAGRVEAMHQREAQAPRRRVPLPMTRAAEAATEAMVALDPALPLTAVRDAAAACRQCPLWEPATQTVFGEGPVDARIMLIGEQPGDQEDLSGRPFVGPAGQLLDRALRDAGLDRSTLYMTNAVKHFRFQRRGKRRLHQRPEESHVHACRSWLAAEIERVRPQIVVCLGATAASALMGSRFRFSEGRGQWHTLHDQTQALVTVHPSWVLRQGSGDAQDAAYAVLVDDLRKLLDP